MSHDFSAVNQYLAQAKTEPRTFNGASLPSGVYHTRIITAEFKETSTGKPMLGVMHEVTSGEFQGRKHFVNITLSSLDNIRAFVDKMAVVSLTVPDELTVRKLQALAKKLANLDVKIFVGNTATFYRK